MIQSYYHKFQSFIFRHYRLDLRAIALMRIGIALLVLCDLWIRSADLKAHYSDSGMWPSEMLAHSGWKSGYWTFHALSGSVPFEQLLFALHALFAVLLLIGFQPRLMAFVIYLFTISLHNRNIFVLQAGDDLLRLLLLACVLLPSGERYALSARKKTTETQAGPFSTLYYLLLLASVYVFTLLLKSGEDWRVNFNAVHYALELRQLRMPFGEWLLLHPSWHAPLTVLVMVLEASIAPLLLIPSKTGKIRLLALLIIIGLHLGIGCSLYVGLFFVINIVSSLALLPAGVMDKLERLLRLPVATAAEKQGLQWPESVAIFLIVVCLSINLSTLPQIDYEPGTPLAEVINAARLDQRWAMFSPGVLRKDGWLVYFGRDELGRQWDLWNDKDYVDFKEPASVKNMYKNDRWRKWAENMQDDRFTFLRPLYCEYMLQNYNRFAKKRKVRSMHLYFMEIDNAVDSTRISPQRILYSVCHD